MDGQAHSTTEWEGESVLIEFANLPPSERAVYFEATAAHMPLSAYLVEKDFWVCFTLQTLFNDPELAKYLTFKGGTFFSKVYQAIDRFSEDIDLAVCREKLGFGSIGGPEATDISMKERKRRLENLNVACSVWIQQHLFKSFQERVSTLIRAGDWKIDLNTDPNGNQQIFFHYPQTGLAGLGRYVSASIRIELTARTDNHPAQWAEVIPYVSQQFPDALRDSIARPSVLCVERTFWEKATILHQYHYQPAPSKVAKGFSRHYYDVFQLNAGGLAELALADIALLREVAEHKACYYPQKWARYDLASSPKTLQLLPHADIRQAIANDYQDMQEMIFGPVPDFDAILNDIGKLQARINKLDD